MGVKISELNSAEQVQNNDVLPIVQNDETKKVTKEILLQEVVASLSEKAEADNVYTKEESNTFLNGKVDKVAGKGLSTEDYTTEDKGQVETNKINIGTLQADSGATIELSLNTTNYVLTAKLKNKAGTVVSTAGVDLPIESAIVDGYYDNVNKKIVLVLQNGNTIDVPVGDLISGLQAEITEQNKLSSDLVDDTNKTNKFVTNQEKTNWNAKYDKPNNGIPKSDLSNEVQTSLGKADTALQEHQDISGKEDKSNKVTEITDESTDTQYPSAKCVYDSQALQDASIEELQEQVETLTNTVESELEDRTATGTSITVNDSANAPAVLLPSGNTYQETTSISEGDEYDSPSPEHEQTIHNVSGHNEFKISNADDTEYQTAGFTLVEGQKMFLGDYSADDGIHQLWGEVTLDGVNNKVIKNDSNVGSYLYIFSIKHEKIAGYCSHFNHYTGYPSTQSSAGKFNATQSANAVYFNGYGIVSADNSQLADANEFNSWLQTHNIIFQYKLENPVIIPYTELQQAQYNKLKHIISYYQQTNVNTISAGDLEAILNLDYKKSNRLRIDALEQAIISLGGNI